MHLFLFTVYGDRPWHKKIEHNEYILENGDLTREIQSRNWNELIKPGETVYMTMLVKRKGIMSDIHCRQCRAINIQKICGDTKMEWCAFQASHLLKRFKLTDAKVSAADWYQV